MEYTIRINTISDLEKYLVFFGKFKCEGILTGESFTINAMDALELSKRRFCIQLQLSIKKWKIEQEAEMTVYLLEAGLLVF